MSPPRKSKAGWLLVILAAVAIFGAIMLAITPVNGLAYLAGAGEPVTAHVTESPTYESQDDYEDRRETPDEVTPAQGYYEVDGQRETVWVSQVDEGDVIDVTLPVIDIGFSGPTAYKDNSDALSDVIWALGVAFILMFAYVMIRYGVAALNGQPRPNLPVMRALGRLSGRKKKKRRRRLKR